MLKGQLCELCKLVIEPPRSDHQQTKYHDDCAREMKRRNTLPSWFRDQRQAYMREYMRKYRQRQKAKAAAVASDTPLRSVVSGNTDKEETGTHAIGIPLILSPLFWDILNLLSFDSILKLIRDLHLVVLEAAALAVAVTLTLQHLRKLWKK